MDQEKQDKKKSLIGWIIGIVAAVAALFVVAIIAIAIAVIAYFAGADEREAKKHQAEIEQIMIEAEQCMDAKDYEKAILLYQGVVVSEPDIVDAFQGLAEAYFALSDQIEADATEKEELEEALEYLNMALEILTSNSSYDDTSKTQTMIEEAERRIEEVESKIKEMQSVLIKKKTKYNDKDKIIECIEYEYDEYGNVTMETRYNADGTMDSCTLYEYNQYGEVVRMMGTNSYGTDVTEYEYDINGNTTKQIDVNDDNTVTFWIEYDYYADGTLYQYRRMRSDGTNEIGARYEYDDKGNKIKEIYFMDNAPEEWAEYEYDENGNKTKCSWYFSTSGLSDVSEYEYDSEGNLIGYKYTSKNITEECIYEKEYDEYGNLIMEKTIRDGEESSLYTAEYDEYGNVTMEKTIRDGKVSSLYTTEYEYYEDVELEPLDVRGEMDLSIYGGVAEKVYETVSGSFEEDEDRYKAFFDNEYDELAEKMQFAQNNFEAMKAYADLDKDGLDELLIGSEYGVYAVVTEVNGMYNVSDVSGWRIQYGVKASSYLGNGCFLANESNGNNYGGESEVNILWTYQNNMKACGVKARLSCSYDMYSTDNDSKWVFFEAKDDNNLSTTEQLEKMNKNLYVCSEIDFGANYENDLKTHFNEMVSACSAEGTISFDWQTISR